MANPLSPLSSFQENTRSQSFTMYQETTHHEEEPFYDADQYNTPSSPFEADLNTVRQQSQSPTKLRDTGRRFAEGTSPTKFSSAACWEQTRTLSDSSEDKENQSDEALKSSFGYDPDETCASAFSMVPTTDMTRFTRVTDSAARVTPPPLRSPTKASHPATPLSARMLATPRTASPTPRVQRSTGEDSTTQLLEFTEQMNAYPFRQSPTRKPALGSPARFQSSANLLDFDLPPVPTPRSIPTISVREVETLKANFLSQISSLKATINGKDATISSLIEAKDDAERRVGDISEVLREASDAKKVLLEEKEDWEKRDNEIKGILRDVKSELVHREKERDDLTQRLEESDRKREEAEARASEADSRVTAMEDKMHSTQSTHRAEDSIDDAKTPNKAIEAAVEKVARELHQLYKQKHESKVTALKKSYESRWEKKVRELESRIEEITHENEELKNGRETTMTKFMPGMAPRAETSDVATSPGKNLDDIAVESDASAPEGSLEEANSKSAAQIQTLILKVEIMEHEIQASQNEVRRLQDELEVSRAENSDLVAVVEEMLQLDPSSTNNGSNPSRSSGTSTKPTPAVSSELETRGASSSSEPQSEPVRPPSRSGLAAPKASGMSRPGFGFGGPGGAALAGGSRAGVGPRSGIMSSIERMGRGR